MNNLSPEMKNIEWEDKMFRVHGYDYAEKDNNSVNDSLEKVEDKCVAVDEEEIKRKIDEKINDIDLASLFHEIYEEDPSAEGLSWEERENMSGEELEERAIEGMYVSGWVENYGNRFAAKIYRQIRKIINES